jgi:hypothetical protein
LLGWKAPGNDLEYGSLGEPTMFARMLIEATGEREKW